MKALYRDFCNRISSSVQILTTVNIKQKTFPPSQHHSIWDNLLMAVVEPLFNHPVLRFSSRLKRRKQYFSVTALQVKSTKTPTQIEQTDV